MSQESNPNRITSQNDNSLSDLFSSPQPLLQGWHRVEKPKPNPNFEKPVKVILKTLKDGSRIVYLEPQFNPDSVYTNNSFYLKFPQNKNISIIDLKKVLKNTNFNKVVEKLLEHSESYLILAPESKQTFKSKVNREALRRFAHKELELINADPQGDKSIDPQKHKHWAKARRSVNRVEQDFNDFVRSLEPETLGISLAIKGYGNDNSLEDRENLVEQFLNMQYLQKALPKIRLEALNVCNVFAVFGSVDQSWLVMEDLSPYQASQVKEKPVVRIRLGGGQSELPDFVVSKNEYPKLFEIFQLAGFYISGNTIDFREIEDQIKRLGYNANLDFSGLDLAGRNILEIQSPKGGLGYVLIDQRAKPASIY